MTASKNRIEKNRIDVVKHRWVYIGLSLLLLVPGIFFMVMTAMNSPEHSPFKLGIDFTGGTILEYGFERVVTQDDIPTIRTVFDQSGYPGVVVQIAEPHAQMSGSKDKPQPEQTAVQKQEKPHASLVSVRSKQITGSDAEQIQTKLSAQFGPIEVLQKNSIGPTLASELLTNGVFALLLAYLLIVGYLTLRFQFDYAVCAIVALVHDTLTVFGIFSMMGYFFGTEIDSLFVTGILTVVGFSVHDTIVVFDRLRENSRLLYSQKLPFGEIANISVNQTLARSINTSLTALLTLLALYFFGGETTKDFVLCMIIGIAIGTYSSIFVASASLTWWRGRSQDTHAGGATPAVA